MGAPACCARRSAAGRVFGIAVVVVGVVVAVVDVGSGSGLFLSSLEVVFAVVVGAVGVAEM